MSDSCALPQAAEASDAFASIQVMGKTSEGNAFDPWKIWKIKKIKEALDRRRRHPTTTTTTAPPCASGEFFFSFPNLPALDPAEGLVTGCIAGLSCGNETAVATVVRVLTNEAGFGLGEYFSSGRSDGRSDTWNVSTECEILPRSFFLSSNPNSVLRLSALPLNDTVPISTCGALRNRNGSSGDGPCTDPDQVTYQYIS